MAGTAGRCSIFLKKETEGEMKSGLDDPTRRHEEGKEGQKLERSAHAVSTLLPAIITTPSSTHRASSYPSCKSSRTWPRSC
jgi:hypothetical protein